MPKYRKKPVVIEAIKWDGQNQREIEDWAFQIFACSTGHSLSIKTLEGTMVANIGDWIIKGVKGELYPCKPDIFKMTYEEVIE